MKRTRQPTDSGCRTTREHDRRKRVDAECSQALVQRRRRRAGVDQNRGTRSLTERRWPRPGRRRTPPAPSHAVATGAARAGCRSRSRRQRHPRRSPAERPRPAIDARHAICGSRTSTAPSDNEQGERERTTCTSRPRNRRTRQPCKRPRDEHQPRARNTGDARHNLRGSHRHLGETGGHHTENRCRRDCGLGEKIRRDRREAHLA